MKKMIISVLALLGMVACTNENEPEIVIDSNEPVEVKMVASIVDVNAKTRAIAEEGKEVDVAFAKQESTTDPTAWTDATQVTAKINTDKSIAFTDKQYYSSDAATNTYFVGYSPAGTLTNGTVTFKDMDGSQDIIYATVVHGNKTSGSTTLSPAFNHKLSQIQFKFKKDASFSSTATVASITIKGTKLPVSLDVANGNITYAEAATDITAFTGGTYAMTDDGGTAIVPEKNLVEVGATGITLDITLSDNTQFTGVPITLTTKASTAHVITLTFKQAEATGSATIGKWETDNTPEADVQ